MEIITISEKNFAQEVNRIITSPRTNREATLIIRDVEEFDYYYNAFGDKGIYVMTDTLRAELDLEVEEV